MNEISIVAPTPLSGPSPQQATQTGNSLCSTQNDSAGLVMGIDLSGPSNPEETVLVVFRVQGESLHQVETILRADDSLLWERISAWLLNEDAVLGLDAPLSYQVGGGDRPGDRRLRNAVIAVGLRAGTVMPPTLNRMAYLTLRGIVLSRILSTISPRTPRIVEVHPSATMALRGAPIADVVNLKQTPSARRSLLAWLESQGLKGAAKFKQPSDHYVAACAAALAAWEWSRQESVWLEPAQLPFHPFDYAC
ncbi:MAG: DUF429 domain-containing protein [Gemmataceae bacterium]|nr:DUF429 domain-containing protein [Gemmataceae bacterium]